MKFHPETGDYAAGVRGDGGVLSINGAEVLGPSAQFGGWLDHRAVCQFYGAGPTVILAYPGGEVLAQRGANKLRAGGGVWAARLDGFGLFSSTGFGGPDLYLSDVGPDGAIAYTPHAGYPIRVREHGGDDWLLSDSPAEVTLLGDGAALIYRNTSSHSTVTAIGMPQPTGLPEKFYSYIQRGDWCAYQREQGPSVVIRRHADPDHGWLIHAPLAYGIDLFLGSTFVRVGFSRREGEQPGDLHVEDIPIDRPMVDLRVTDPEDDEEPDDDDEPEEPVTWNTAPETTARLVAEHVRKHFPDEWAAAHASHSTDRRYVTRVASYLHYGKPALLSADPKWGLNGKRGTDELSEDILNYKNPAVPVLGIESYDFFRASMPEAGIVWNNITDPAGAGAKWIQPPRVDETEEPEEPDDCTAVRAELSAAKQELASVNGHNTALVEEVRTLTLELEDALSRPVAARGYHTSYALAIRAEELYVQGSVGKTQGHIPIGTAMHLLWRLLDADRRGYTDQQILEEARLRGNDEWHDQW